MKIEVPTGEIYLGEELEISMCYERKEILDGTLEIESPVFPGFEINDINPGVEKTENGIRSRIDKYKLIPATAGTFEIRFPGIKYHKKDGKTIDYVPESKIIIVKDIPEWMIDAIDVRDIKNPLLLNIKQKKFSWRWIMYLLLILIILYLIHRMRRKESDDEQEEEIIKIDGYEEFRDSIERLKGSGLLNREEYKEFTTELSMIFRTYLMRKFNIPAQDLTSEELTVWAGKTRGLNDVEDRFIHIFDEGDLIKFAKAEVELYQIEDLLKETETIVEKLEKKGEYEISGN